MKDYKTSEITLTGSAYHLDSGTNSPEEDNIDVTSIPKLIHVHELESTPKTPVMIDFNTEEYNSLKCKNCNTYINLEDTQCNNCGSLNGHSHENIISTKDENDRTSLSIDYTYVSQIADTSNEYPKIRVEDEEGISIHSNTYNIEDWKINPGVVKFDKNVDDESNAPSIRNGANDVHGSFSPKTEDSDRKGLEQNNFGDDTSLCSNVIENVNLRISKSILICYLNYTHFNVRGIQLISLLKT